MNTYNNNKKKKKNRIVTNRDEQGEKGRRKNRPMEGEEKWQGPSGVASPEGLLEKFVLNTGSRRGQLSVTKTGILVYIKDYSISRDKKKNQKN